MLLGLPLIRIRSLALGRDPTNGKGDTQSCKGDDRDFRANDQIVESLCHGLPNRPGFGHETEKNE